MKIKILPAGCNLRSKQYFSRGFSLLELLVVIAIVGLFSSFLMLRLEGFFSEGALRQAAKMIISDIGILRAKAAYTHLEQQMVFNIDDESYHIIGEDAASNKDTESDIDTDMDAEFEEADEPVEKKLPPDIDLEDIMWLTGEKEQEGEATLRFFPNGSVQSALIHLRNDDQEVFTLEVNPLTGHVTIHDTYIEQKIIK